MTAGALEQLAAALRAESGLLADATVDPGPDADRSLADAVLAGPRAAIVGPTLALAAEATREAELLHHAPEAARVLRTDDRDLALLAGDRLYAFGLLRLAEAGWTDEVAILSDVVALVARLHAGVAWEIGPATPGVAAAGTGPAAAASARTDALWRCAVAALGQGEASPAATVLREVRRGVVPPSSALIAAAG